MAATVMQALEAGRSGAAVRVVIGSILGVVVTSGLLWTMQFMIETVDRELNEGGSTHLVDFVRIKRDEAIQRRELKPTKPPPPSTPPPQPAAPQLESLDPGVGTIAIPQYQGMIQETRLNEAAQDLVVAGLDGERPLHAGHERRPQPDRQLVQAADARVRGTCLHLLGADQPLGADPHPTGDQGDDDGGTR